MSSVKPGWYPDPSASAQMRWWDGTQWTEHIAPAAAHTPPPSVASPRVRRGMPTWAWVLIGLATLLVAVVLARVVVFIALAVLITAIVALRRGSRTWLRLKSRRASLGVLAGASLVLLLSGAVSAASLPHAIMEQSAFEAQRFGAPATTAAVTPITTPTPTPTPTTVVREESVTEAIPFDRTSVEDANIPRGQTAVTVSGLNGERTLTYRVTLVDGVETARELVSDVVTVAAVTEVTTVGTYDPPPPPPAAAASNCDSNYADACVPIASDVDCAWGSGNGPAYFDGVARVVGRDVYDLDRDGDGLACER